MGIRTDHIRSPESEPNQPVKELVHVLATCGLVGYDDPVDGKSVKSNDVEYAVSLLLEKHGNYENKKDITEAAQSITAEAYIQPASPPRNEIEAQLNRRARNGAEISFTVLPLLWSEIMWRVDGSGQFIFPQQSLDALLITHRQYLPATERLDPNHASVKYYRGVNDRIASSLAVQGKDLSQTLAEPNAPNVSQVLARLRPLKFHKMLDTDSLRKIRYCIDTVKKQGNEEESYAQNVVRKLASAAQRIDPFGPPGRHARK